MTAVYFTFLLWGPERGVQWIVDNVAPGSDAQLALDNAVLQFAKFLLEYSRKRIVIVDLLPILREILGL